MHSRRARVENEYQRMLRAQGGRCAVCHQPEQFRDEWGKLRPLTLYLNNATGETYGLICLRHNIALQALHDSPQEVAMLLEFLTAGLRHDVRVANPTPVVLQADADRADLLPSPILPTCPDRS